MRVLNHLDRFSWPLASAMLLLSVACSSDDPLPGQAGWPCPNDNNCNAGFQCIQGVCTASQEPIPTPDAGVTADAGMTPDAGVNTAVEQDTIAAGLVANLPDGTTFGYTLSGNALLVRGKDGSTSVRLEISGLEPNTEYEAHVHDAPCATGGGAHYKIDTTVDMVIQANEIWPVLTSNENGRGIGAVTVPDHLARNDAASIVLHQPDSGERIGCADLNPNGDVTLRGTLSPLAAGTAEGIGGTIELRRYGSGTTVTVNMTGTLESETVYPIHVHDAVCETNEGGAHYKIDEGIEGTEEDNEIWPSALSNAEGTTATGDASNPHIARSNAYSIVVHRGSDGARLACGNFYYAP